MKREIPILRIVLLFIFLLTFVVYLKSVAPTIFPGDSGELIAASYTLGLPHPPSFPLYVLVGRLFSLLPLGEIAFRVNLMGPVCAGLICLLVFLAAEALLNSILIAAVGSLFFLFTPGLWLQLNRSEVYGLYLVILAAIFLLFSRRKLLAKWNYLLVFLLALGFGSHPGLAISHFIVVIFLIFRRKIRLFPVIFSFTLVFFIYFFLPIRSWQAPLLNWGKPANISSFLYVIFARGYDVLLKPTWAYFIRQLSDYLWAIWQYSLYFGVILVVMGAYQAIKQKIELSWLFIAVILVNPLFLISSNISSWHPDFHGYFSPVMLALLFLAVLGLNEIVKRLKSFNRPFKLFLVASLMFSIIFWGVINYRQNDQSRNYLAFDYAQNIMQAVNSSPSQLALFGDNEIFGSIYLQAGGRRRAIGLRNRTVFGKVEPKSGKTQYYSYWFYLKNPMLNKKLSGLLYQNLSDSETPVRYHRTRGHRQEITQEDYFSRWLVAQYYLPLLQYYLNQKNTALAERSYEKIVFFAADIAPAMYRLGRIYLEEEDLKSWEKAARVLEVAVNLDVNYYDRYIKSGLPEIYNDLGLTLRKEKNFQAAAGFFLRALQLTPGFHLARYNLATTWEMAGKNDKAAAAWTEYLALAEAEQNEAEFVKKAKERLRQLRAR